MLKFPTTFRFLLPLTCHPLRVTLLPFLTCSLCISISCSSTLMVSWSSPITDSLQADDYNLSTISTHCGTQTHCKQTMTTYQPCQHIAVCSGQRAGMMTEGSWVRIMPAPHKNFGYSIYPTFPVLFGGAPKAVGAFYLVSTPGEVKYSTHGVNV